MWKRIRHLVHKSFLLTLPLFGETIGTFYGPIEVEEPVLLELIGCPAFQRLKEIHQYGVAYYTTHREEYNRFDHSVGVFAILRAKGASLEEQIAGLLHDVSHTAFSHVGDWVFNKEYQEDDYQSTIHRLHMASSGLEEILNKHGYTTEQIHSKNSQFVMLEQPLPNLCADRIDYNIQGAFYQHFLTAQEAQELFEDLDFIDGRWLTTKTDLAKKLTRFSLFMTEDCWGSAVNYVTSRWLADAILQGLQTGLISWNEFHFGTDEILWNKLQNSHDPLIEQKMHMIAHPASFHHLVAPEQATLFIKFRCRGIDPWILSNGQTVRLTELDESLLQAFQKTKEKAAQGWPIVMR
jgi:hypothetical protein